MTSRLRLLQEATGIKDSIIGLEPQVAVSLPADLCSGPVSDKTGAAAICSPDQKSWDRIHAVLEALSPLKNPVDGYGHSVGESCFDMRVDVNEVDWARACSGQNSEVVSFWKKRIEGAERV